MKRIFKVSIEFLFLFFLSLYISKYSINYNENKKNLTEQAILQYENDLKEGINIDSRNYQKKEKNYNNKISKVGRGISNIVEKVFNKGLDYMIKYLNYIRD